MTKHWLVGDVSVEHTVWCATARNLGEDRLPFRAGSTVGHPFGCASHRQESGPASAVKEVARGEGWIYTRLFGWLCPPCAAAYREWNRNRRRTP